MKSKWVPEVLHHAPHTPFVVIATKIDLRPNSNDNKSCVSVQEGETLAKEIAASAFFEISSKLKQNVHRSMEECILLAARHQKSLQPKTPCSVL